MCVGVSCVVREGHSGERGNENPWLWAWQRGLRCWVEGGRSHGWVSAWMGVLHLMRRQVTGLGRLEGAGWELSSRFQSRASCHRDTLTHISFHSYQRNWGSQSGS